MTAPIAAVGTLALAGLRLGFPEDASAQGWRVDALYQHVLLITGVAFVVLECLLLFFTLRYRARATGVSVAPSLGRAGALWGGFIVVVAIALIVLEGGTWVDSSRILADKMDNFPEGTDTFRVEVQAEQFMWHFRYPGPDGRFATEDDITSNGMLHVPVGRPVVLQMRSKDVIHSLYLPNFREKMDVVPGLTNRLWFQPARAGRWEIMCAELCGLGHYTMRAWVVAEPEADLARWLTDQEEYRNPDDAWGWEWVRRSSR